MIPRPVKVVVFVFPWEEFRHRRAAEDERIAKEGGPKVDESVFWMKQTVRLILLFLSRPRLLAFPGYECLSESVDS